LRRQVGRDKKIIGTENAIVAMFIISTSYGYRGYQGKENLKEYQIEKNRQNNRKK
jgi:hypothetical protein